jgi:hypothetical protein
MRILAVLLLGLLLLAGCSTKPEATSTGGTDAVRPGLSFLPPVNMTKVGSARETSLAIDPTNPLHLFACDPSGVPAVNNGHSYFYESKDGGQTWRDVQVETAQTDPRKETFEGGDCDVAFDAKGTMYTADTWLGEIAVGSSTNGESWQGTVIAGGAPVADRPWLVGGPDGTVYLTYQDVQFGMPSAIWFTKSTDHGLTFSPDRSVATAGPNGVFTWTGNFVVSPDGQTLHSVYTDAERVEVATSHDGGATWSSTLVSARPHSASYLYPAIAQDRGGQLHVVFSQGTDTDQPTWYSRSTDGAKTWSAPIPILTGVASGAPWVAANRSGEAYVEFAGSTDPKANAGAAKDADWFLYIAHMVNGTVADVHPTTTAPLFHGKQAYPEFNMVRIGPDGGVHIGASIQAKGTGTSTHWQAVHQKVAESA